MDSWRTRAACRGVPIDVMVPPSTLPEAYLPALEVCAGCDVVEECLEDALSGQVLDGVFGGTTPKDRRKLLNRRARGRRIAA